MPHSVPRGKAGARAYSPIDADSQFLDHRRLRWRRRWNFLLDRLGLGLRLGLRLGLGLWLRLYLNLGLPQGWWSGHCVGSGGWQ